MKKIIVCGSRTFSDYKFPTEKLDEITKDLGRFELVFGACPIGADKLAFDWFMSEERGASQTNPFPANWKKHGRAAGPIRNREMAEYAGKDGICVAFWDRRSRGTANMIHEAEQQGMQVHIFYFSYDNRSSSQ